jgi:hypothetical protein
MKKLLIVLSALVLTVAFAVPALAMELYDAAGITSRMESEEAPAVVVAGELTFGWITPFASEDANIGFDNSYVDVSVWPFDYNVVTFRLAGDLWQTSPLGGGLWFADYMYLTTDIGMWFDLPVGVENTLGVTSLYSRKYEVTGGAIERDLIRSDIDPVSWKIEVDAGMAIITGAIGIGETDASGDGIYKDIGFVAEIPEAGPVDFECFYLAQDDPDLKGRLGADAKLVGMIPMVDLAAGFVFDLSDAAGALDPADPTDYIEEWAYGVGANLTYSMATVGVAIDGTDRDTLNRLEIDGKVDLGGYGVQGGIGLSFADDIVASTADESETFQGAEIGVFLEVNAATWKAGYVITDQGYTYASAVAGPEGGLFLTCDIDL